MKSRFFKTSLCLALAISIVFSCSTGFEASFANETNDIIFYDNTITIDNNEVLFNSFNITENYPGSISLYDQNGADNIDFAGTECIDGTKIVKSLPEAKYKFFTRLPKSGSSVSILGFDKTGGVYRKVRLKLFRYGYFNYDGSHTQNGFDYHFGEKEVVGESNYTSCLIIVSGGAINFVVPDSKGFVEFYVSTNIDAKTSYYTEYYYNIYKNGVLQSTGNNGGLANQPMNDFTKGCIKSSYISIADVTEIQCYISKMTDFGIMQRYRADVDNNNDISILDATKIQLHLASKK